MPTATRSLAILGLVSVLSTAGAASIAQQAPPSGPLRYANFVAQFSPDGAFKLSGPGWPAFAVVTRTSIWLRLQATRILRRQLPAQPTTQRLPPSGGVFDGL